MKITPTYTAYDKAAEFGSDAQEGYPLKAKADRSARVEAKKIAAEKAGVAAQEYGVRMKSLLKFNAMKPTEELITGQKIFFQ